MGRRAARGLITRFTTGVAGFTASFDGDFAEFDVSITDVSLGSGFVINFLVGVAFMFDFEVDFSTTLGLTAAFSFIFDFSVMTHILFWIIETPSPLS
jgi:hypothetical protein